MLQGLSFVREKEGLEKKGSIRNVTPVTSLVDALASFSLAYSPI